MTPGAWVALIEDWFADTLEKPESIEVRMRWWFSADRARDKELAMRYGSLVEACMAGRHYRWLEDPAGRLALILALDQLPRNLFRGTAKAFACDAYAAALCLGAVSTGLDRELLPIQRAFLYLPLQHFEDLQAQLTGVTLYERLSAENRQWPIFAEGFARYARLHRDIIARFGRFPHRNRVLGRTSTAEESEYLADNAPNFGQ